MNIVLGIDWLKCFHGTTTTIVLLLLAAAAIQTKGLCRLYGWSGINYNILILCGFIALGGRIWVIRSVGDYRLLWCVLVGTRTLSGKQHRTSSSLSMEKESENIYGPAAATTTTLALIHRGICTLRSPHTCTRVRGRKLFLVCGLNLAALLQEKSGWVTFQELSSEENQHYVGWQYKIWQNVFYRWCDNVKHSLCKRITNQIVEGGERVKEMPFFLS